MKTRRTVSLLAVAVSILIFSASPVAACGGFFCTTIPVDQAAERIVFAMDEGKVTTFVQINYSGSPDDFAWVLPVPSVPTLGVSDMATFRDLDRLTAPVFIPPPAPDCLRRAIPMAAPAASAREGVQVLASGTVGPFGYDVVTSPDPQEMVRWLQNNGYRIESEMEPLIKVYTDEGMAFLAMKLQPGKDTSDITPIRLEYEATQPMIPLRLTAVAAQPNMGVLVWVFGTTRTVPLNYVDMTISDGEILFSPFGQNNYRQVVAQAADQAGGRAFVTEFAGPTSNVRQPIDPTAQLLIQSYPYLTRFYTRISADEMTVDPVFDYDPSKGDVSNVHDLSSRPSPFECTDDPGTFKPIPGAGAPPTVAQLRRVFERYDSSGTTRGGLLALAVLGLSLVSIRLAGSARDQRGAPRVRLGDLPFSIARRRPGLPSLKVSAVAGRWLLLEALLIQGLHEIEHLVQVVQRSVLDIKLGAGLFGSVFDLEPVHLLYNLTFLGLLALAFVGCRRMGAIPRNRTVVLALLGIALAAQSYHSVEHLVKIAQFLETGRNGTPGLLGQWLPVVWLHFWFNTLIYLPVVAAFALGGFSRWLADEAGRLRSVRWRLSLQS